MNFALAVIIGSLGMVAYLVYKNRKNKKLKTLPVGLSGKVRKIYKNTNRKSYYKEVKVRKIK